MANRLPRLGVVLLAAGASRRLGSPKQDVILHGVSLLERSVALATTLIDHPYLASCSVHVVCGAHYASAQQRLANAAVTLHQHAAWADGQASSLSFGLSLLPDVDGVLVLLVDQYRLNGADVGALVERWRGDPNRLVVAAYANTVGVPVIWPARLIGQLRRSGKSGRALLATQAYEKVAIEAAAFDLDTAEDLIELRSFELGDAQQSQCLS